MSKPAALESIFLPAPIGGLNRRDSLANLPLEDAHQLTDFYPLASGIRPRGLASDVSFTVNEPIKTLLRVGKYVFVCTDTKIKYDQYTTAPDIDLFLLSYNGGVAGWDDLADYYGAGTITFTNGQWQHAIYTDSYGFPHIVICNGVDPLFLMEPTEYDGSGPLSVSSNAFSKTSLAFDDPNSFVQVFSYKRRLYFIDKDTPSAYYTPLNPSWGGTIVTEANFGPYIAVPDLCFGTSWTITQGLTTEEVAVFVATSGEVLIFSGDYPDADNWQLIATLKIPKPVGRRGFYKLGSELYIQTIKGVIPLSQSFKYIGSSATFYASSDKLGVDIFNTTRDVPVIEHEYLPLLFFGLDDRVITMNYQTGAWSEHSITDALSFMWFNDALHYGSSDGNIYKINETSPTIGAVWQSAYQSLGTAKKKNLKRARMVTKRLATASAAAKLKTSSTADFAALPSTGDTKTGTAAAGGTEILEFALQARGQYVSVGTTTVTGCGVADIYGAHLYYETGGDY